MTTYAATGTSAALANQSLEVAFILITEGYNIAWTSHPDVSGLDTAWAAASQWTVIRAGLSLPPEITHSMSPFSSKVEMQSLTFRVTDTSGDISTVFEREASTDATTATIALLPTASLEPDGDFAVLQPGSQSFSSTGTVYVDGEEIDYTINAGNVILGGFTRGKHSLWGTSSDEDNYGRLHEVDMDQGVAPEVTTHPGELVGRNVALYMCVKRGGVWTAGLQGAGSNAAENIWSGRLQSVVNNGDGTFTLDAASILELLKQSVFSRQLKARLEHGKYLLSTQHHYFAVSVERTDQTTGITLLYAAETTALISSNDVYDHDEIKALINDRLLGFFNNAPGTEFPSTQRMSLERSGTTGHYVFALTDTASDVTNKVFVFLDLDIWTLLGWTAADVTKQGSVTATGLPSWWLTVDPRDTGAVAEAPHPPQRAGISFARRAIGSAVYRFRVRDVEGRTEYVAQSTIPSEFHSDTTGFLKVGSYILAVKATTTTNEYQILGWFDGKFAAAFGAAVPDADDDGDGEIDRLTFEGADDDGVPVSQVWFEFGSIGDLLLRMMLSTGTSAYNHATYDVNHQSMGLALPYTLLDVDSISGGLNRIKVVLFLDTPAPLLQLIEGWSGLNNRRLAWRRGRITSVGFGEEASDDVIALTEDNKAARVDANGQAVIERPVVRRTRDHLINQIKLRHSRDLTTGEWFTETVNDIRSQSKYGVRTHTLDGIGVYSGFGHGLGAALVTWRKTVEAVALAYFARPLAVIERSFDISLLASLYPGAKVSITDNHITNPTTGTPGVSDLLAWCVSTSFDFRSGVGRAVFLFAPHLAQTAAHAVLPPSARIDTTVNSGSFSAGYDSTNKILALMAHHYSGASDDTDASHFAVGDKVRVVQRLTETDTITTDTVAAVDGDNSRITLTTGGALTFSSTLVYDLEYEDVDTVVTAQRAGTVYLADASTHTTGNSANDERVYSGARTVAVSSTVDYDTRHTFFDQEGEDGEAASGQGQPLSVHVLHEIHDWCNGALSHFTANRVFEWVPTTVTEYVEATDTSSYTLLLGPVWIPLYGGSRQLTVQAYAARGAGSSGIIQVITSTGVVRGSDTSFRSTTTAPLLYPDGGVNNTSLFVLQSGYDYTSEASWTPAVVAGEPPGCWLTVTALAYTGGYVRIRGLWVREAELS
jgi:hypothetical protein